MPSSAPVILLNLVPKSVYRANQLRKNHFFDELLARVAPANAGIDLDRETPSSPERISDKMEQYYTS